MQCPHAAVSTAVGSFARGSMECQIEDHLEPFIFSEFTKYFPTLQEMILFLIYLFVRSTYQVC